MDKVKINYKDQVILDQDSQKDASFMVEETDLNLQQDVIATKRELKSKRSQLGEVKSTYPLEIQRYLDLSAEIESLEGALKKVAELQEELGFKVTATE